MASKDFEPILTDALRELGNRYGPLGVALAAASLTDTKLLMLRLEFPDEDASAEPSPLVCPVCGGAVKSIERRIEGRRVCERGDIWKIVSGHVVIMARVKPKD